MRRCVRVHVIGYTVYRIIANEAPLAQTRTRQLVESDVSGEMLMGWQEKATLEGVGLGEGGSDLV